MSPRSPSRPSVNSQNVTGLPAASVGWATSGYGRAAGKPWLASQRATGYLPCGVFPVGPPATSQATSAAAHATAEPNGA